MFSTSFRLSINYLFQSYICVLESVSSPNCALSLIITWAGFTFSLVRNVTIHCATAEGTCLSIVITADKKQVDSQRYDMAVIGIPSLTTSNVILFYAGISAREKKSPVYIWTGSNIYRLVAHRPGTTRFIQLLLTLHLLYGFLLQNVKHSLLFIKHPAVKTYRGVKI
jgi:hypothetical protein